MNNNEQKEYWKSEEALAHIHGWDFSHIHGRFEEKSNLPWNYKEVIHSYLQKNDKLLDIDTGGGEFLLSLKHDMSLTSATEGYPPNVALCKKELLPLGIDFKEASDYTTLPFADSSFHMVINRHGAYDAKELYRILKPGGLFITQQVGEQNDRELVELLLPGTPKPFPGMNLSNQITLFQKHHFDILEQSEAFRSIRFFDTGALVWFAKIIEWEFPGFSVDTCFEQLLKVEGIIKRNGCVQGITHRYLIVARKKSCVNPMNELS